MALALDFFALVLDKIEQRFYLFLLVILLSSERAGTPVIIISFDLYPFGDSNHFIACAFICQYCKIVHFGQSYV